MSGGEGVSGAVEAASAGEASPARGAMVPPLRFKEFSGDWVEASLGDFCDCLSGYPIPGDEILETPKGVLLLRGANITEGRVRHSAELDRYYNGNLDGLDRFLLHAGDVVIGMDGSKVGKNVAIIGGGDVGSFLIQRVARLRALKNHSLHYVYQQIIGKRFRTYVDVVNTSSGIPHISLKQIRDFPIKKPTLPEQEKIAGFLGAVDARLGLFRRRRDALNAYKKGLMQRLFTQSLRFTRPNGSPFPDWEEYSADELFRNVSNKNHNGDLPILAATQECGVIPRDQMDMEIQSSAASVQSYKIVDIGDFVISLRSFQGGIEFSKYHGICSPAYTVLKPNLEISTGFYGNLFKTRDFIERLSATVVGIRDGKQISYSAFSTLSLPYPHPEEQHKIAAVLTALDAKIDAVSAQLSATTAFKKGLLQQMFV